MSHDDLVWLGGFFDGDGSYREFNNGDVEIVITQKNLAILELVKSITGLGYIRDLVNQNGTFYHRLVMTGKVASNFYALVRPYLRSWKGPELDAIYTHNRYIPIDDG